VHLPAHCFLDKAVGRLGHLGSITTITNNNNHNNTHTLAWCFNGHFPRQPGLFGSSVFILILSILTGQAKFSSWSISSVQRYGRKNGNIYISSVKISRTISRFFEGRPINKLQNGIILLILKIRKIRDIRFLGNLFLSTSCEFHFKYVIIMTSFRNSFLRLPWSR